MGRGDVSGRRRSIADPRASCGPPPAPDSSLSDSRNAAAAPAPSPTARRVSPNPFRAIVDGGPALSARSKYGSASAGRPPDARAPARYSSPSALFGSQCDGLLKETRRLLRAAASNRHDAELDHGWNVGRVEREDAAVTEAGRLRHHRPAARSRRGVGAPRFDPGAIVSTRSHNAAASACFPS